MSLNKLLLTVSILIAFALSNFGQNGNGPDNSRHYPSVMLGVGSAKFTGDVGKENDASPLEDARAVFYLKGEYRFGKYFGLMAGGLYGKLAGNDNSLTSHRNFQSSLLQVEMNFVTYFDHLFKLNDEVSPFLGAGLGYMMFNPYGNLTNAKGQRYHYWSDGSIRDLPETTGNASLAMIVKEDDSYETRLSDTGAVSYSRACLSIPLSAGFDWRIGKKWDLQIGVNYTLLLSDYVDNYKNGGNDSYLMGHLGIKYTFVPKQKSASDDVNFAEVDHLDVDGDGVPDDNDHCLSTPKGVEVDKHGCPPDADHDGVADYMDKEPGSRKGAQVNEYGVTLNLDSIAYHTMMWDSLADERREVFDSIPSLKKMETIDQSAIKKGNWDHSKIPEKYKEVDANKDGYITAKEVYLTLDSYFDGITQMTATDIEDLINYFFEQE